MTNPTPPTPTGDSVTNPAGGVMAANTPLPWTVVNDGLAWPSVHAEFVPDGPICSMANFDPEFDGDSARSFDRALANAELIVASVNRLPAILAAVEKALAALSVAASRFRHSTVEWEDAAADCDAAMSELRAIHGETKGSAP